MFGNEWRQFWLSQCVGLVLLASGGRRSRLLWNSPQWVGQAPAAQNYTAHNVGSARANAHTFTVSSQSTEVAGGNGNCFSKTQFCSINLDPHTHTSDTRVFPILYRIYILWPEWSSCRVEEGSFLIWFVCYCLTKRLLITESGKA